MSEPVTIGSLIERLADFPPDAVVVLSKDGEGNDFSPLGAENGVELGWYQPECAWSGLFVTPGEDDTAEDLAEDGFKEAVCLLADQLMSGSYLPPRGKPEVMIVDIDGTVALGGDRGPFDWHRVGEDTPSSPVVDTVTKLHIGGWGVIFLSGRMEQCRPATEAWLWEHLPFVEYSAIWMRPDADYQADTDLKLKIFDAHIRREYRVRAVFDDRTRVVKMWRAIGLTVFQVAEGNF